MLKKQIDTLAECPFFRYHTRMTIACEGIIPDTGIINTYNANKDKHIQYEKYCCEKYQNCEIYEILMEKYRTQDE